MALGIVIVSTQRLLLPLLSMLAVASAEAKVAPHSFVYLRQDGGQAITISMADRTFAFTDPSLGKSDLGGLIKDCGRLTIRCLNLGGYLLSAPNNLAATSVWTAGGGEFSVVGQIALEHQPSWLIEVRVKGDAYMHFSYSPDRGVESISLQAEDVRHDLAKTFFLTACPGLLARTDRC
jgi:hypothetical protein